MTKTGNKGMTLIEIMMSVMILSLGLLGILSVVPFIEFHSGRIVESDFVASVGTNAFGVIKGHQWENPANWVRANGNNDYVQENAVGEADLFFPYHANYLFPRLLDPFLPAWENYQVSDAHIRTHVYDDAVDNETNSVTRVFPNNHFFGGNQDAFGNDHYFFVGENSGVTSQNVKIFQDIFLGHDDLVYERDENSQKRPQILTTIDGPQFTGAYSWAALMTLVIENGSSSYDAVSLPVDYANETDVSMKIDVMVFRGRDYLGGYDSMTATATQVGTGYAGGGFTFSGFANTLEFQKSLESSTHLLLIGPSDEKESYFSGWYRIANFSRDANGFLVTLTGDTTPKCWNPNLPDNRSGDVRVVLFRNLRGVFTRTLPVTAPE